VVDLFPGASIPEIRAEDLTLERLRSAIRCHGSLIVRGLLNPARVLALVTGTDRAMVAFDRMRETGDRPSAAPYFVAFRHEKGMVERKFRRDAGGVLAVDSPPAMFEIIEAFEEQGIGALITDYFGEPPAILARKWTLRKVPHDAGPSSWHQDGAFMGEHIRSLNVWVALSHCGVDAPGIDIVGKPLGEIVPPGTDGAILDWTVGQGAVERVATGTIERPVFAPGDAMLFDHLNLHRTAVEPQMTRDRYAIEAWFFAPSTYAAMVDTNDRRGADVPRDQAPMVYFDTPS
jgi:hypothetical protein